jgi:HSP20 family protein
MNEPRVHETGSFDPFRLLDQAANAPFGPGRWRVSAPPTDVVETEHEIRVIADLPGLSAEEIEVDIENNVLTFSVERRERAAEGEGGRYHLAERRYGRFSRSFILPRAVDADRISAHYEAGVLTISIPLSERARGRRIEIGGTMGEPPAPEIRAAGLEGDPTTPDQGEGDDPRGKEG